ncbi:MAG: protein kinase domain-containing protein [Telluria sp.]
MYEAGTIITLRAGSFRLREPIASSAYGQVWRADGPPGIGEAALKLVNTAQMARAGTLQARWIACAQLETALLSSLQPWEQRHIVRLLDSGAHQNLPVLALELLQRDLARHVREHAASVQVIIEWIGQVNQALAKVHQRGWRYLDLKPGNLLLDDAGNLKLSDFGTIRPLADSTSHEFIGSPGWQAPEQCLPNPQGSYDTDARTDYFALGAVFYYLVTQGTQLRFCRAYAEAHRAGGDMPRLASSALAPEESERFADCIERGLPGAGRPALALLKTLLAPQRSQRPRHALDISRALAAIKPAQPAVMRSAA